MNVPRRVASVICDEIKLGFNFGSVLWEFFDDRCFVGSQTFVLNFGSELDSEALLCLFDGHSWALF